MSQSPVILNAEHLCRRAGGLDILDDVSLSVRVGDVLAIVGPSGSGKSSLLRLLNRLDEPTSGTVFVESVDYRLISPRQLRRKIGMVAQRPFLFPGTVLDNVGFGPRQCGETFAAAQAEELLATVGLAGYGERDVTNLSGGEAQRVSLARTLANNPIALLLDEPTSALDENSKAGIEALINGVVREGHRTCVMVTHDIAQAARMATRVMMLDRGRVTAVGSVEELLHAQSAVH